MKTFRPVEKKLCITLFFIFFFSFSLFPLVVSLCNADTVYVKFEDLTDALKKSIKEKLQAQFDKEFGVGVIKVTDDPKEKADRSVNFRNFKGKNWGNTGDGENVNVNVTTFKDNPAFNTDEKLVNGLVECAAHEVGHTYSANHNRKKGEAVDKMTDGVNVSPEKRAKGERSYNEGDITKMKENFGKKHKPVAKGKKDVSVYDFMEDTEETNLPEEDNNVDAAINVEGTLAEYFNLGWYSDNGLGGYDFVIKWMPEFQDEVVTIFDGDTIHFGLQGIEGTAWEGMDFDIGTYGDIQYSDPFYNPKYDTYVFRFLSLSWDIDMDGIVDETVTLNTALYDSESKNGFLPVPEPSSFLMMGTGLVLALLFGKRHITKKR